MNDGYAEIIDEIREMWQSRSNFALVHFVAQRHDTAPRMRFQVLRELQIMISEIDRYELRLEQIRRDICRLETSNDQDADLRIAEKRIDQRDIELDLIGKRREYQTLCAIREALPRYSYEEFQAAEPEYYAKMLGKALERKQYAALNQLDDTLIEDIERGMRDELLPGVGRIEKVCLKQLPSIDVPIEE